MRFQPGIVGCLLASCAVQPTNSDPLDAALAAAGASGSFPALRPSDPAPRPPAAFVLRIGVEHLPPDEREGGDEGPRLAPTAAAYRAARPSLPVADREGAGAAERLLLDLASTDDPLAHEALHFVSDMIQADRNRAQREVGLPFFDFRAVDPDRGPLLNSEQDQQNDHDQWMQEHGTSLLQRPLRQLLRRLPFARDAQVEFDSFRSENVPLTEPYQAVHDRRSSAGHVSVRVHIDDLHDPVELSYVWAGVRIGSSQGVGKLALDLPLADTLRLEVRARTEYATGDQGFRIDVAWRQSARTSLHLAIGDDMEFLTTSSIYSLFESPMDGSPGLVLYAVHIF